MGWALCCHHRVAQLCRVPMRPNSPCAGIDTAGGAPPQLPPGRAGAGRQGSAVGSRQKHSLLTAVLWAARGQHPRDLQSTPQGPSTHHSTRWPGPSGKSLTWEERMVRLDPHCADTAWAAWHSAGCWLGPTSCWSRHSDPGGRVCATSPRTPHHGHPGTTGPV